MKTNESLKPEAAEDKWRNLEKAMECLMTDWQAYLDGDVSHAAVERAVEDFYKNTRQEPEARDPVAVCWVILDKDESLPLAARFMGAERCKQDAHNVINELLGEGLDDYKNAIVRPSYLDPAHNKLVAMDEGVLPCDVLVAPATRIGKGCKLSTLMNCIELRAKLDPSDPRLRIHRPSLSDQAREAGAVEIRKEVFHPGVGRITEIHSQPDTETRRHLQAVVDAYFADTGAEPSVSVLARAADEARAHLAQTDAEGE